MNESKAEARNAARDRIVEALSIASAGHGRFSAWVSRPKSETVSISLEVLYRALDGSEDALRLVRTVGEVVAANRTSLTSWAAPDARYIVSISGEDLIALSDKDEA